MFVPAQDDQYRSVPALDASRSAQVSTATFALG
jgi:hypothetical protein